jgi:hypothetical protein
MAIARFTVKVGKVGKALAHAEYIEREGNYAKQKGLEDLEHSSYGNMPKWAEQNPMQLWQSADLYERKNGSTYREYEISLPRELNKEQRQELVEAFVQTELGTKYPYQYAIHNPMAMDGLEQPHVHLMFNERLQDGIERDPEQYFKRYNSKNPEKGGAKKDNTGKDYKTRKDEIKELRQRWENITNEHLKRAGLDIRIDMRSYTDQGIDKQPEPKLLPSQARDPEIRHALTELRQSEKILMQINLGDLKTELEQLKQSQVQPKPIAEPPKIAPQASQITDSMMQEGKNQARAWFEEMKAQKAREEQQRQAEEKKQRQQDKDQDLGMSL